MAWEVYQPPPPPPLSQSATYRNAAPFPLLPLFRSPARSPASPIITARLPVITVHARTPARSTTHIRPVCRLPSPASTLAPCNLRRAVPGSGEERARWNPYLLSSDEERNLLARQRDHAARLRVPRRPEWDQITTPAKLAKLQADAFLDWRRSLAMLQDGPLGSGAGSSIPQGGFVLTPFERNIEVWRQLWRVVEGSHLNVQIVDARNPLRFRCEDLEKYAAQLREEQDEGDAYGKRRTLLLINKSDLLEYKQRRAWADYFDTQNIQYAFFSAARVAEILEREQLAEQEKLAAEEEAAALAEEEGEDEEDEDEDDEGDPAQEHPATTGSAADGPAEDGSGIAQQLEACSPDIYTHMPLTISPPQM